ncbi:hypothetical protein [Peribacillus frigoritolerans]|uniref:hypothetical protein n=1 Tax=Peribacillus frigoritolerans TaxID=450367 RepID=UPI0031E00DD5
MERKVRDSCGKSVSRGDPAGVSRGGFPTARGKRVPEVEINVPMVKILKWEWAREFLIKRKTVR